MLSRFSFKCCYYPVVLIFFSVELSTFKEKVPFLELELLESQTQVKQLQTDLLARKRICFQLQQETALLVEVRFYVSLWKLPNSEKIKIPFHCSKVVFRVICIFHFFFLKFLLILHWKISMNFCLFRKMPKSNAQNRPYCTIEGPVSFNILAATLFSGTK